MIRLAAAADFTLNLLRLTELILMGMFDYPCLHNTSYILARSSYGHKQTKRKSSPGKIPYKGKADKN